MARKRLTAATLDDVKRNVTAENQVRLAERLLGSSASDSEVLEVARYLGPVGSDKIARILELREVVTSETKRMAARGEDVLPESGPPQPEPTETQDYVKQVMVTPDHSVIDTLDGKSDIHAPTASKKNPKVVAAKKEPTKEKPKAKEEPVTAEHHFDLDEEDSDLAAMMEYADDEDHGVDEEIFDHDMEGDGLHEEFHEEEGMPHEDDTIHDLGELNPTSELDQEIHEDHEDHEEPSEHEHELGEDLGEDEEALHDDTEVMEDEDMDHEDHEDEEDFVDEEEHPMATADDFSIDDVDKISSRTINASSTVEEDSELDALMGRAVKYGSRNASKKSTPPTQASRRPVKQRPKKSTFSPDRRRINASSNSNEFDMVFTEPDVNRFFQD